MKFLGLVITVISSTLPIWTTSTLAGPQTLVQGNGIGTNASINSPQYGAFDAIGNLYFSSAGMLRDNIWK